jgi:ATP-dependent protease ClpP protease subunit
MPFENAPDGAYLDSCRKKRESSPNSEVLISIDQPVGVGTNGNARDVRTTMKDLSA